jgi:hypothetical protein
VAETSMAQSLRWSPFAWGLAEARRIDMRRFILQTEGSNTLGFRELCQRFADEH